MFRLSASSVAAPREAREAVACSNEARFDESRSGVGAPAYTPEPPCWDEGYAADGAPREPYERIFDALDGRNLEGLTRALASRCASAGVCFGGDPAASPFRLDIVPRVLAAGEWRTLAPGLAQRARALNHFIEDIYGARRIVAEGVVPERVISEAEYYEPLMTGLDPATTARAVVGGFDLIRTPAGELRVLEDNMRTPSGVAYAVAAREAGADALPYEHPAELGDVADAFTMLDDTLRAIAPCGVNDPRIVLLSDGPGNSAWFEHRRIAAETGIALITPSDLTSRDGRLFARADAGRAQPVDVVYRRTDEDRLTLPDGSLTAVGALLYPSLRAGTITVANSYGCGVADDKLVHAYVERMISFYLSETPILRSVTTFDLGDQGQLQAALERIDELVVKPRAGYGGEGICVMPHAHSADRARATAAVRAHPERFVAQETVFFSTHPTAVGARLAPRHVDLRPFAYSAGTGPDDVLVPPGGLTRVAFDPGALVVNSSQNGGGKDTWVLTT